MTFFAAHETDSFTARDIADAVRLPLPVISKVLKMLARDGLLISRRGARGGYGLARHSREISVAAIIHALEGPIAITECNDLIHGECGLESGCPVKANWNLINRAIHSALEKITLAEMTQPLRQPLVNLTPTGRRVSAS
jgi:FeS assembly SUF system regulator